MHNIYMTLCDDPSSKQKHKHKHKNKYKRKRKHKIHTKAKWLECKKKKKSTHNHKHRDRVRRTASQTGRQDDLGVRANETPPQSYEKKDEKKYILLYLYV